MAWIGISIFLILSYGFLILHYRKSWLDIPAFVADHLPVDNLPFISIVIAARNEEKNIGSCIQTILSQHYPTNRMQLIVVDDHSTDRTENIIQEIKDERLLLLHLKNFLPERNNTNSYKKMAIEIAIQHAKGDLIVTTDADCYAPSEWLQHIAHFYLDKRAVFIAAPVAFVLPKKASFANKFLDIFQVLDFMTLQGITGASVHSGFHNMCNGANLAYEKKVFEEVGGFAGIDEIASGDDMLLMQKMQQKYPNRIAYLKSQNAIISTQPEGTIKQFLNQRIRWASKSGKYQDHKIKLVLLLVYIINLWMVTLFIAAFVHEQAFIALLFLWPTKIIFELIFLFPVARFFGQQRLLYWFVPAQPFHILYTIVAGWLGMFGKYQWKERTVK